MSCRFLLVVLASCVAAQTEPTSLTITASRSVYPQPDEAVFGINVFAGPEVGVAEILATLRDAGVADAKLTSVTYAGFILPGSATQTPVNWTFTLNTPLSKLKDTAAVISGAQQSIAANKPALLMRFATQGVQVSEHAQSEACSFGDLIGDARAQAQKLAGEASLKVASILALSYEPAPVAPVAPAPYIAISGVTAVSVDIVTGLSAVAGFSPVRAFFTNPSPSAMCQITVKFALAP